MTERFLFFYILFFIFNNFFVLFTQENNVLQDLSTNEKHICEAIKTIEKTENSGKLYKLKNFLVKIKNAYFILKIVFCIVLIVGVLIACFLLYKYCEYIRQLIQKFLAWVSQYFSIPWHIFAQGAQNNCANTSQENVVDQTPESIISQTPDIIFIQDSISPEPDIKIISESDVSQEEAPVPDTIPEVYIKQLSEFRNVNAKNILYCLNEMKRLEMEPEDVPLDSMIYMSFTGPNLGFTGPFGQLKTNDKVKERIEKLVEYAKTIGLEALNQAMPMLDEDGRALNLDQNNLTNTLRNNKSMHGYGLGWLNRFCPSPQ